MAKKVGKRCLVLLLGTAIILSMTACGGSSGEVKDDPKTEDGSGEEKKVKREWDLDAIGATIMMGTVSYSHGVITKPEKYPCWDTVAKDHKTGELTEMVQFDDRVYVDGDEEMVAFFAGEEAARTCTSADHDLMYIYHVPVDATVNIEITSRVFSEESDGIIVYAYMNDPSDCLVEETLVEPSEDMDQQFINMLEVKKGDKLYFGYGPNESNAHDEGNFYIKLIYMDVAE